MVNAGAEVDTSGPIDALGRSPARWLRLRRVLRIILLFVAVGPLLGTIVQITLLTVLVLGFDSHSDVMTILNAAALMLSFGMYFGYLIGGIPACLAGALIGIKQIYFGGAGWRFALCMGLVMGFWPLVFIRKLPLSMNDWEALVIACIVSTSATLGCWSIVKSWYLDQANESSVKT